MAVTFDTLLDGVAAVFEEMVTAGDLQKAERYDKLSEDFQDVPMAQVYLDQGEVDASTATAQHTFRGAARMHEVAVGVDIPCRQRGDAAEDMKAVVDVLEAVTNKLDAQQTRPWFGSDAIKSWRWRWQRVTFVRGEATPYVGLRVTIWLRVA